MATAALIILKMTAMQVAVGTTFAVKALGVGSVEEFRDAVRGFGDPMAQSLQEALQPVKARIQVSRQRLCMQRA